MIDGANQDGHFWRMLGRSGYNGDVIPMGNRYTPLSSGKSRTSKCPTELALALEVFTEKGYLRGGIVPLHES